jgi:hypothetical protein
MVRAARESVVKQWEAELAWYRSASLVFGDDARRREFFDRGERTLASCASRSPGGSFRGGDIMP